MATTVNFDDLKQNPLYARHVELLKRVLLNDFGAENGLRLSYLLYCMDTSQPYDLDQVINIHRHQADKLQSLRDSWIDWCRSYSSYYGCNNDFPLRQYRYARLVETYMELFGREKVMVLPMEMLSRAPRQFFTKLEDFARIRPLWGRDDGPLTAVENRSPGRLGIGYQRTIKGMSQLLGNLRGRRPNLSEALEQGRLHSGVMRWLELIDRPMRPMSQATAAWLDDYYCADNQALIKLTGLDLAAYGYVC